MVFINLSLAVARTGLEDANSAEHYFRDLASANASRETQIEACAVVTDAVVPSLPGIPKCALIGTQVRHVYIYVYVCTYRYVVHAI